MLEYALRFDHHIVGVDLDILSNLLFENPIHKISGMYRSIFLRLNGMTL